jgi:hypothetical protein
MSSVHDTASRELEQVRIALADEYEIVREVGRGGMAVVYHGRERELGRDVAIKVLLVKATTDAAFVARFQQEARTAAQLAHPHIVPIHRVGRRGDVIFFVMKLLGGPSVSDRLLTEGPLGAAVVRQLIIEAGNALGYAHRHGVIHRDIKPENVMFDEGRCVITDFGIARSGGSVKLTATGTAVGTPLYMSPEQGRGRSVDARSDIYSLGIVAYECLTGSPPFTGDNAVTVMMHHVQTPLPRPRLTNDEERALFDVIARMLAKSPNDRFQGTDELITAVNGGVVQRPAQSPVIAQRTAPSASAIATTVVGLSLEDRGQYHVSLRDRVMGASRLLAQRIASGLAAARAYAWRKGRRFWIMWAVTAASSLVMYESVRMAILYHSRCPSASMPARERTEGALPDAAAPLPFSVLVDNIGSVARGSDLDVYYDVCGLDRGTAVTTRISVAKNQSGLKRIFGGVAPVLMSFDEAARGPATRRHRTVDLADMPPGSYTLALTVSDERGRERERSVYFQITSR